MKLESVRELKLALTSTIVTPLAATIRTRSALGEAARSLTARPEAPPTLALGVAPKRKGEYALAIRVQQRALENGREVEMITRKAKGEVDVRYVGAIKKHSTRWHRTRQRPLRIGCSIGHVKVTAGTLGAFVRPRGGGALGVLSNNHVLANENRCRKGDSIIQQANYDGGVDPADCVAALGDFVPLRRHQPNHIDAATATVADGISANLTKLTRLGKLAGLGDVFVDEGTRVAKVGRTTGLTRGIVTAFELDNVRVEYDIGVLEFDNQIEIEGDGDEAFSDGGDSGSLIVNEEFLGVGLLFAGGDQGGSNGKGLTYANPLRVVLDQMAIELAL